MNQRVSVTVAAMAEREGRFLVVEEETDEGMRLNQPAGHLEPEESLIEAVVRETLEETAYRFVPRSLLGVYRWRHPAKGISYVRFAFVGEVTGPETGRALDAGILRALWLTPAELSAQAARHRSPLVQRCIQDYLAGRRFPLDLLIHYG
jgi:8-oxo-dGTP pyrophosphatase MutT (NUDIX family)